MLQHAQGDERIMLYSSQKVICTAVGCPDLDGQYTAAQSAHHRQQILHRQVSHPKIIIVGATLYLSELSFEHFRFRFFTVVGAE